MHRLVIVISLMVGLLACPEYTTDDLSIVEETDAYVVVEYQGDEAKFYKEFAYGFEEPDFFEWFGDGKWTTMSLLSPAAKDVQSYADLRTRIFAGEADFVDNRIDPELDEVFRGAGAARFYSVAPSEDMVTAKAMLENNGLWFVKGDHLWFRGQYFLADGVPFTIVDFQERGRNGSPGPRVTIWEQTHLGLELKYGDKPKFHQDIAEIPLGQWFELKVHLVLDEVEGQIQIWQDGVLIIDTRGRTLPEANSLLNALEIGVTATAEESTVLVDDVVISHQPF